jgi:molecular chaperone DnaK
MQFASPYRRKIENLIQDLRACLKQQDDRGIDIAQADLRDALYDLQQEVYQVTKEDDEDKDFFGSIRRTLSNLGEDLFGDDDDYYDDRPYSRDPYANYSSNWGGSYERRDPPPEPPRRDYYDRDERGYDRTDRNDRSADRPYDRPDRDPYADRGRDAYGNSSREPSDPYSRDSYARDSYARPDRSPDRDPYSPRDQRNVDRSSLDDYGESAPPPRRSSKPRRDPNYDDYREYDDRDTYSRNSSDRDAYSPPGRDASPRRGREVDRRGGYSNAPDEDWGDDDEWL